MLREGALPTGKPVGSIFPYPIEVSSMQISDTLLNEGSILLHGNTQDQSSNNLDLRLNSVN